MYMIFQSVWQKKQQGAEYCICYAIISVGNHWKNNTHRNLKRQQKSLERLIRNEYHGFFQKRGTKKLDQWGKGDFIISYPFILLEF